MEESRRWISGMSDRKHFITVIYLSFVLLESNAPKIFKRFSESKQISVEVEFATVFRVYVDVSETAQMIHSVLADVSLGRITLS